MSFSHDDFIEDLIASRDSVWAVAHWFSTRGYPVAVPPLYIRPSLKVRNEYTDEGDLSVLHRIEVKHRKTLKFTSRDDFPHDTVIVDACGNYDKKRPAPYAYAILDADQKAMAVVMVSTKDSWTRVAKRDSRRGMTIDFYEVPKDEVHFVRLGDAA